LSDQTEIELTSDYPLNGSHLFERNNSNRHQLEKENPIF